MTDSPTAVPHQYAISLRIRADGDDYFSSRLVRTTTNLWEVIYEAACKALPNYDRQEVCGTLMQDDWEADVFVVDPEYHQLDAVPQRTISFSCPWRRARGFKHDADRLDVCYTTLKQMDDDILCAVWLGDAVDLDALKAAAQRAEASAIETEKQWDAFVAGVDEADRVPTPPLANPRQIELNDGP